MLVQQIGDRMLIARACNYIFYLDDGTEIRLVVVLAFFVLAVPLTGKQVGPG